MRGESTITESYEVKAMELSTCRSVATCLTSLAENAECKQFFSLERGCGDLVVKFADLTYRLSCIRAIKHNESGLHDHTMIK